MGMISRSDFEKAQPYHDVFVRRWFVQWEKQPEIWSDALLEVNQDGGYTSRKAATQAKKLLAAQSYFDKEINLRVVKRICTIITTVSEEEEE